jgi:hypothetical protein
LVSHIKGKLLIEVLEVSMLRGIFRLERRGIAGAWRKLQDK